MGQTIRIIGIDPGLRRTGWGIIESLGNSLRFVGSGTITLRRQGCDLASRLCQLHDGLAEIVHVHKPHEAAVEQTFVNKDAAATLKLGQARGIAMLVPARAGLAVAEYAPNAVKKAVIGVGHGDKKQIHMMVKVLMPKADFTGDDAADALAIAICHAHHRQQALSTRRGLRPHDRQTQGHDRRDRRGLCARRCAWRLLRRLLLGAHAVEARIEGEAAVLFIETYVREDLIRLFGFTTALEREWFRLLQSVQGVGSKVALAVLSTLTPSELANAIALQDKTTVSRAPGVGPKVAHAHRHRTEEQGTGLCRRGDAARSA